LRSAILEAITISGFAAERVIIAGAPAITSTGRESDNPAAALVATNFRRLTLRDTISIPHW
jgi:hypothetical protein